MGSACGLDTSGSLPEIGTLLFVLSSAAQIAGSLAYLAMARPDHGTFTVAISGAAFLGVTAADNGYSRGIHGRARYGHLPDSAFLQRLQEGSRRWRSLQHFKEAGFGAGALRSA